MITQELSAFDILENELVDLARSLAPYDVPVIVGGGFGLILRQRMRMQQRARTLRSMPESRSTDDIDLFLTAELIGSVSHMTALRDVLTDSGYVGVRGALYYQFHRPISLGGFTRNIKVDLLAPLPESSTALSQLSHDSRRVRPRSVKKIHAHVSPEALTIGEHLEPIVLERLSGSATIFVPHPFSYLLLKLHAYRDRMDDERTDHGRHHAFDLYRIIAMMTAEEWAQAVEIRNQYSASSPVQDACRIVHELFANPVSPGSLAVRDQGRKSAAPLPDQLVQQFLSDLLELLPLNEDGREKDMDVSL